MIRTLFLAAILLLESAALFAQSGTWSLLPNDGLPSANDAAMAAYNNTLYMVGGLNGSGYLSTIEVFDPATLEWTTPTVQGSFIPRNNFALFAIGDKIYAIGGQTTGYGSVSDSIVQIFDPATNTWTTPQTQGSFEPRSATMSVLLEGKIYVVGGGTNTHVADSHSSIALQVFDPLTNMWTTPQTTGLFLPRAQGAATVVNGKIYVIGGMGGDTITSQDSMLSQINVFDPVTNTWTTPETDGEFTPSRGLTATTINGMIYAIGGYSGVNSGQYLSTTLQIFDPTNNTWSSDNTSAFSPRAGHAAAFLNGSLYLACGAGAAGFSNVFEMFTPDEAEVKQIEQGFRIFPNPFHATITIANSSSEAVEIFDVLGRLIWYEKSAGETATLNVSEIPPGMYVLHAGSTIQTVIKE